MKQLHIILKLILVVLAWTSGGSAASTSIGQLSNDTISAVSGRVDNTGIVSDIGVSRLGGSPQEALLTDVNLRLQQHDQEQRLDRIQQLQQTIKQQQQLQRQTEVIEQMRQLQLNMSAKIQQLGAQRDDMLMSISSEIRNQGKSDGVLVQQHYGGTNFFSKNLVDFKSEFGDVTGNYWIGNQRLHQLTKDGLYRLRVDLLARHNNLWYWAEYGTFRVFDESSGYTLNIGDYIGSAGDSLSYVTGRMFSAKDADRDMWSDNCAVHAGHGNGGGFWYNACAHAFLNSPHEGTNGFSWLGLPIGSGVAERKLLVSRMTLLLK